MAFLALPSSASKQISANKLNPILRSLPFRETESISAQLVKLTPRLDIQPVDYNNIRELMHCQSLTKAHVPKPTFISDSDLMQQLTFPSHFGPNQNRKNPKSGDIYKVGGEPEAYFKRAKTLEYPGTISAETPNEHLTKYGYFTCPPNQLSTLFSNVSSFKHLNSEVKTLEKLFASRPTLRPQYDKPGLYDFSIDFPVMEGHLLLNDSFKVPSSVNRQTFNEDYPNVSQFIQTNFEIFNKHLQTNEDTTMTTFRFDFRKFYGNTNKPLTIKLHRHTDYEPPNLYCVMNSFGVLRSKNVTNSTNVIFTNDNGVTATSGLAIAVNASKKESPSVLHNAVIGVDGNYERATIGCSFHLRPL